MNQIYKLNLSFHIVAIIEEVKIRWHTYGIWLVSLLTCSQIINILLRIDYHREACLNKSQFKLDWRSSFHRESMPSMISTTVHSVVVVEVVAFWVHWSDLHRFDVASTVARVVVTTSIVPWLSGQLSHRE